MKRLSYLLSSLLTLVSLAFPALLAHAEAANLIANPSAETAATATTPANWTFNSWGTNTTTQSYSSDAHTGSKSLSINMTARTDGDAKWMPDAATVTPSTSYTYTSWYKATAGTELDLMYTDASGNVSYAYVKDVPAVSSWTQLTATFTTPANAAKVAPMQIVAQAGSLQIDDVSLESTVVAPPATDANLVVNPSFDVANGSQPANWTTSVWGTNTTKFTYESTGRTGGHSATVAMTAYTSGDAKWVADPVAVTAGSNYTYTDYYKSSVVTRVVAAFETSTGTTTYSELPTAAAATSWTAYSTNFTAPANAAQVSIYHLIDRVGTLTIDDTGLTKAAATVATTVPNPSVETANGSTPAAWAGSSWGTNTTKFTYEKTGHTGSKSVKTTVSNYTDGDAKWYFDPISTLTPGKDYSFSAWYKTNTQPYVVVMSTDAQGNVTYTNMPNPLPPTGSNTTWQKYSGTFTVPQNSVSITVFMLIKSNGWLQTDDYDIANYTPTGFSAGMVTLTFDDGWDSIYDNGLPLLKKYGMPSTQYIISGKVDTTGYMTKAEVKAFQAQGSEVGSHTVSHPFLTQLTSTQLTNELKNSQTNLRSWFGSTSAQTIASPYGDYNQAVITQMKKYYTAHRSVDAGFNSKDNFNAYNILVQNINPSTTTAQVASWVAKAKADKTWLVLVYHQVENTVAAGDSDAVSTSNLDAQLNAVKASGVQVKTMTQALTAVKSQL